VPAYGLHVAEQVSRLGRQHPLIKTQYYSEEIDSQAGMFAAQRQSLMQGNHPALHRPRPSEIYALLLDVAGEGSSQLDHQSVDLKGAETSSCAATALTVVQVDLSTLADPLLAASTYRVVNRYLWVGATQSSLYAEIKALMALWDARCIVIDATGIGAGLASFLEKSFYGRVVPVTFFSKSKSELGWRFLAIVETGRYKEYTPPHFSTPLPTLFRPGTWGGG
jgi:hypothetical protein